MKNVTIAMDQVVDHDAEHNQDWAAITVCVDVTVDGKVFSLNFQSTTDHSYQSTSKVGLNTESGDQQDELAELFPYIDSDGEPVRGAQSDEYDQIVALAQAIAQEAADKFFAELPEKSEDE